MLRLTVIFLYSLSYIFNFFFFIFATLDQTESPLYSSMKKSICCLQTQIKIYVADIGFCRIWRSCGAFWIPRKLSAFDLGDLLWNFLKIRIRSCHKLLLWQARTLFQMIYRNLHDLMNSLWSIKIGSRLKVISSLSRLCYGLGIFWLILSIFILIITKNSLLVN